jgi:hypothetical protein
MGREQFAIPNGVIISKRTGCLAQVAFQGSHLLDIELGRASAPLVILQSRYTKFPIVPYPPRNRARIITEPAGDLNTSVSPANKQNAVQAVQKSHL